ncbi:uncharacterized protein BXZ73DRAFT_101485 [Epithele typhae]|uniref:uncharacterized protein n=1 Tax=Epithele typhae TaxID=378194 RepID=UPI00200728F8|nr:uncharacterized protein BXZ73DRAFT_101485 [Epithele typhae]KAH9932109.1 hypothetical protein BXZ73DRAFT_101485 [Epithele typhae]
MNRFIDHTISVDDVYSPSESLFSCVVTQLDHFMDTKKGDPREYVVVHVALPPAAATADAPPAYELAASPPIGFIKFERCWSTYTPLEAYDKCSTHREGYRHSWSHAHDTVYISAPGDAPLLAFRHPTLLRSYHNASIPLPRVLVAAGVLRRLHLKCCEDTYAHAWFARALWQRLVPPGSADVAVGDPVRPRSWLADYAYGIWELLAPFKPVTAVPPQFVDVLDGREVEACQEAEDRVLLEFAGARAKIAGCLSKEGEWISPEDQAETVEELGDAVDAAVWPWLDYDHRVMNPGEKEQKKRMRELKAIIVNMKEHQPDKYARMKELDPDMFALVKKCFPDVET